MTFKMQKYGERKNGEIYCSTFPKLVGRKWPFLAVQTNLWLPCIHTYHTLKTSLHFKPNIRLAFNTAKPKQLSVMSLSFSDLILNLLIHQNLYYLFVFGSTPCMSMSQFEFKLIQICIQHFMKSYRIPILKRYCCVCLFSNHILRFFFWFYNTDYIFDRILASSL